MVIMNIISEFYDQHQYPREWAMIGLSLQQGIIPRLSTESIKHVSLIYGYSNNYIDIIGNPSITELKSFIELINYTHNKNPQFREFNNHVSQNYKFKTCTLLMNNYQKMQVFMKFSNLYTVDILFAFQITWLGSEILHHKLLLSNDISTLPKMAVKPRAINMDIMIPTKKMVMLLEKLVKGLELEEGYICG